MTRKQKRTVALGPKYWGTVDSFCVHLPHSSCQQLLFLLPLDLDRLHGPHCTAQLHGLLPGLQFLPLPCPCARHMGVRAGQDARPGLWLLPFSDAACINVQMLMEHEPLVLQPGLNIPPAPGLMGVLSGRGCASLGHRHQSHSRDENFWLLHKMPKGPLCEDRKSTRLNSSHKHRSRMPSSA